MESLKQKIVGKVEKISGDKTVRVTVQTLKRHPLYSKVYKVSKVFLVHDEKNIAKLGDVIQAQSCRPISKSKSWRLLQVVK